MTWALVADLIGVAVFAASGASAAVAKRLDLFGVVFSGSSAPWAAGSCATWPSATFRRCTLKALEAPVPAVGAVIIGMLTGIGGDLIRDLLTGEIPVVLRREIYAVAALAGALVVVGRTTWIGTPPCRWPARRC